MKKLLSPSIISPSIAIIAVTIVLLVFLFVGLAHSQTTVQGTCSVVIPSTSLPSSWVLTADGGIKVPSITIGSSTSTLAPGNYMLNVPASGDATFVPIVTSSGSGTVGPQGPQGPAGATGAKGATGPAGPQGPAGTGAATPSAAGTYLVSVSSTGALTYIPVASGCTIGINPTGACVTIADLLAQAKAAGITVSTPAAMQIVPRDEYEAPPGGWVKPVYSTDFPITQYITGLAWSPLMPSQNKPLENMGRLQ